MTKEAYYFSHDSNARHDEKIIMLLYKHDWYGYGLYWGLIEKLRDATDYKLKLDYKLIAFDLKADEVKIESIISDFELFTCENGHFWSDSLMDRMKKKEEKSNKTRQSALSKWGTSKAGTQKRSERLTDARKKGKHTKAEWEEMQEFFNNACVKCNGESGLDGVVRDHIVPIYQGGSDAICNIQPLCARCNAQKGSEDIDHRRAFCEKNACEMPAKFSEMPAIKESKVNESKVNEIKEKEIQHPLQEKISQKYQNISRLKRQLTFKEAEDLDKDYNMDDLIEFFNQMENWKPLTQKNESVNLTIRDWLRRKKISKKTNYEPTQKFKEREQTPGVDY